MMYDPDFDIDIESRWWGLMSKALENKLTIRLEKHIDSRDFIVLHVKIFPIDKEPVCLFSEYDLDFKTELYFKAKTFISSYLKDNK